MRSSASLGSRTFLRRIRVILYTEDTHRLVYEHPDQPKEAAEVYNDESLVNFLIDAREQNSNVVKLKIVPNIDT